MLIDPEDHAVEIDDLDEGFGLQNDTVDDDLNDRLVACILSSESGTTCEGTSLGGDLHQ